MFQPLFPWKKKTTRLLYTEKKKHHCRRRRETHTRANADVHTLFSFSRMQQGHHHHHQYHRRVYCGGDSSSNDPGMFNILQRDRDVESLQNLPSHLVCTRVFVSEAALQEAAQERPASHFVCFGFSASNPCMFPGTPVHFLLHGGPTEEASSAPATIHETAISGMIVGRGKRENEYAVLVSFRGDPCVRPSEVACMLGDGGFNITEMDEEGQACECIQTLCSQYRAVIGYMDPRLRGHKALMGYGGWAAHWSRSVKALEEAGRIALVREQERGFRRYASALASATSSANRARSLPPVSATTHPNRAGDRILCRRRQRIRNAHDKYMGGFIACALTNPVGVKHYVAAWGDFMRAEAGAEIDPVRDMDIGSGGGGGIAMVVHGEDDDDRDYV